MENNKENELAILAIFNQVCQVNDLDPQEVIKEAAGGTGEKPAKEENVASLIRLAFRLRANALVADIDLGSSNLTEGKEYNADGDPAAPSFTINEDYIRRTYGEDKAERIIAALGQVQLPIQA